MPTFKNNTAQAVMYKGTIQPLNGKKQDVLIVVDAGEEIGINFWIPYERLGLELVDEEYPPVPDTVFLSGIFKFEEGTERKYTIEPCGMYMLDVLVEKGSLKLYAGSSQTGIEMNSSSEVPYRYRAKYDWEYAPYIRAVGLKDGTEALIHAEAVRVNEE